MSDFIKPDVKAAYDRLKGKVHRTPLLHSHLLNEKFFQGVQVFFKAEMFQKTGAFKVRGAMNTLLHLQEKCELPAEIVTVSSGNHAQAMAYACGQFSIPLTVYMGQDTSPLKRQATQSYGAKIILTVDRFEAEKAVKQAIGQGAYYVPPFDHEDIIAGQGTACYEALEDLISQNHHIDGIFVTCGGGGWLSGTYLAAQILQPKAHVYGAEPAQVDDATRSYQTGVIHRLEKIPQTIADGARTPAVSKRTFEYIQKCHDFITAEEDEIIHWTAVLNHYLKVIVEPTSAVAVVALFKAIERGDFKKGDTCLVMLSGGNIDPSTQLLVSKNAILT
jgi:threonine dehydratase